MATTEKFFTSTRIPHNSGLYHEVIYYGDDVVAYVMSEDDGTYWWHINGSSIQGRGRASVADCKAELFKLWD